MRQLGIALSWALAACSSSTPPVELLKVAGPAASVWVAPVQVEPANSDAGKKLALRFEEELRAKLLAAGYQVVLSPSSPHDLEARLALLVEFHWGGLSSDVAALRGTWTLSQNGRLVDQWPIPEERFFSGMGDEDITERAVLLVNRVGSQGARQDGPPQARRMVLVVFDVEAPAAHFGAKVMEQLGDYLAVRLSERLGARVVPRAELREQLKEMKRESYSACIDDACQIELGKAVAAEKSVATKLLKVGDLCALTATLLDLRTEATDRAASAKTGCEENELLGGIDRLVEQLRGSASVEAP